MAGLSNMIDSIKKSASQKKFWYIGGVAILIAFYFYFQSAKAGNTATSYVLNPVEKGTLIVSVSGSGQVTVSSQVEVKPKASGQLTSINVQEGQIVKAGAVIAQIDPKDAQKSVRDATINRENAKISLLKTKKPADTYSISQAQSDIEQAKLDLDKLTKPPTDLERETAKNAIAQAERDLENAKNNLSKTGLENQQKIQKAFDDGYTAVSNAYLDLPTLIKDIRKVYWDEDDAISEDRIGSYENILGVNSPFVKKLRPNYEKASQSYDENIILFKTASRSSEQKTIDQIVSQTITTAKAVSESLENSRTLLEAIKNTENYTDYYIAPTVDSLLTMIKADITTINKHLTALLNAKDTINAESQNGSFEEESSYASISTAEEKLAEKKATLEKLEEGATAEDISLAKARIKQKEDSLAKLLAGADALDIQAQELSLRERENALSDAQKTLADYTVRAPFDGVIATVSAVKGDTVSSGTALVTLVTEQLLAEISLNEVDVAKVKNGQKATLKFDADENLTVTGEVVNIDTLGTTEQGVVNYNVDIAFDTQEEKIKPGMSVSAAIITDVRQDILVIPNSALKSQNDMHYVETLDTNQAKTGSTEKKATSTTSVASDSKTTGTPSGLTTNGSNTGTSNTVTTDDIPVQKAVEIGLANDTMTEITSGLKEGEVIITKTIKASTASQSTGLGGFRVQGMGPSGSAAPSTSTRRSP